MFKKLARMMPVGAVLFQAGTCSQQDLILLASALDDIATLADEFDSFEGDPVTKDFNSIFSDNDLSIKSDCEFLSPIKVTNLTLFT